MLTAGEILDDAILTATPYVATHEVPPGPLLRALGLYDLDIVRLVATTAPERLSSAGTTLSVSLAQNLAGYTLLSGIAYGSFTYIWGDGRTAPITIVPESRFEVTNRHPAGIVRLGTATAEFFPADPYNKLWGDSDTRPYFSDTTHQIAYRYVSMPARVTTKTQTLGSPDEAREYLQLRLNAFALSIAGAPLDRRQEARLDAREAKLDFIFLLNKRLPTQASWGEPMISRSLSDEERLLIE